MKFQDCRCGHPERPEFRHGFDWCAPTPKVATFEKVVGDAEVLNLTCESVHDVEPCDVEAVLDAVPEGFAKLGGVWVWMELTHWQQAVKGRHKDVTGSGDGYLWVVNTTYRHAQSTESQRQ